MLGTYADFWTALRYAAFNVVSIATTTGFANTDYALWPMFAPLWMLFLSSFVTCSGSTGGGIKMVRAMILYKQTFREIIRSMHPQRVRPIKFGGEPLPNNLVFAVLAFGFMYMVIVVSLTLLMAYSGLDIVTAFSAVVATINNTGPGLDQVGPCNDTTPCSTDLPDLGMHRCHAARPAGDLHRAGGAVAGFLAQVRGAGRISRATCLVPARPA